MSFFNTKLLQKKNLHTIFVPNFVCKDVGTTLIFLRTTFNNHAGVYSFMTFTARGFLINFKVA